MFINIGSNRTVLFIRQLTGPVIPVYPGIPVQPVPPPLPYPTDNLILVDTLPGAGLGGDIELTTQFINAVAYNVPPEAIKTFDYKSKLDAVEGLQNLNLSDLDRATLNSLDVVNAAQQKLTVIDSQGYLLPDGTSFTVELINIESFNQGDISNVLNDLKANETDTPKKDKFTSTDLSSFLGDYLKNEE